MQRAIENDITSGPSRDASANGQACWATKEVFCAICKMEEKRDGDAAEGKNKIKRKRARSGSQGERKK